MKVPVTKELTLYSGCFTPLLRVCCSQSPLEQQVLLVHGPLPEVGPGLQHAELQEQPSLVTISPTQLYLENKICAHLNIKS